MRSAPPLAVPSALTTTRAARQVPVPLRRPLCVRWVTEEVPTGRYALGAHVWSDDVMRLEGLTAVVTGGDAGIGRAISLAMAREGAQLVIDYHRDAPPAEALVDEIVASSGKATSFRADVSQPAQVDALVEHAVETFGGLDIMVNNAGLEEQHPLLEMPIEVWDRVIATDLTGVWLGSQVAARQMVKQGRGGRIINISSIHEDLAMPTN